MTRVGVAVIKVGGSVLRDRESYRTVAGILVDQLERGRTWIVVSAAHGVTDALERLGRTANPEEVRSLLDRQSEVAEIPASSNLKRELWRGILEAKVGDPDRLLAWGEQASALALQAHLSRLGAAVRIEELDSQGPRRMDGSAIVPGFYVRDRDGRARCFPRGGSDISAVLVAVRLGVPSVRFWKDGGGILANGAAVPEVDARELLSRLSGTIRPLHPAALLLAAQRGIDLILEDPCGNRGSTRIVSHGVGAEVPSSPPSRGIRTPAESLTLIPPGGPR